MSAFSCFEILKSNAKALAKAQGLKLHAAQELIAKQAKFTDFHDLTAVAKRNPMDARLVAAALGDLSEALYEDPAWTELNLALEDKLSGAIAETNAAEFTMEDIEVTGARYDASTGVLTLEVSFTYQGELDPDRAYSASEFYLDASFRLKRRDGQWSLAEDGIEIHSGETDQDRDWAAQEAMEALGFNPDLEYDLYECPDDDDELGPVVTSYRIRDCRFHHLTELSSNEDIVPLAGMMVMREPTVAGEYQVVAGSTLFGVIREGYFWRGDGARFRVVLARL